jgi:hypothetical protein
MVSLTLFLSGQEAPLKIRPSVREQHWFPRGTVKNDHKLSGLKQINYLSCEGQTLAEGWLKSKRQP